MFSLFRLPYYDYLRYEEFYGEGEREILLSEVSSLREQVHMFLFYRIE